LDRLNTAVVRSPLLSATAPVPGRGQKLDLTHLEHFRPGMAEKVLESLLAGKTVSIRPDLSADSSDNEAESREQMVARLHRQMEKYLIREAEKIRRETGSRSLWLAYPILCATDPNDRERAIVAPVMLWPIQARLEDRQWSVSLR